MADLENPEWLLAGRWKWTQDRLDTYLHRNCSIGDIDGHLESGGRHLFIEGKHWTEPNRPTVPGDGQNQALRSLLGYGHTVWYLFGAAHGSDPGIPGDPLFLYDMGADHWADLTALPPPSRRAYVRARLGFWQAEADRREWTLPNTEEWREGDLEAWLAEQQPRTPRPQPDDPWELA